MKSKNAYYLIIARILKLELGKSIDNKNFKKNDMLISYSKIKKYYNKSKKSKSNSPAIQSLLASASMIMAEYDEWIKRNIKLINMQEKKIQTSFKKGNNFLVIEPGYATATIGSIFTIDAWIKSIFLGFQRKVPLILPMLPQNSKRVVNRTMLNYLSKYVEIIEDKDKAKFYLSHLENLRAWHNIYIPCGREIVPYSHSAGSYIEKNWIDNNREPLFKLSESHIEKGNSILKKMGLSEKSWFVCVHVREAKFKGEEKYRDADISTYFDSFKSISERGGWIIRMGDRSMKPMPELNNVIDYALSDYKSDFMDVFLCASAKFMFGTSSGLSAISYIFGIPVAITNNLPTAATYLSKRDLFLPRLMKNLENNKYLPFSKIMSKPFSIGITDGMYRNLLKVQTIPNTSLELKELACEMMDKLDGNLKYTNEEEDQQMVFKSITAKKETMIGLQNFPVQCRLGKDFLNRYQSLV